MSKEEEFHFVCTKIVSRVGIPTIWHDWLSVVKWVDGEVIDEPWESIQIDLQRCDCTREQIAKEFGDD